MGCASLLQVTHSPVHLMPAERLHTKEGQAGWFSGQVCRGRGREHIWDGGRPRLAQIPHYGDRGGQQQPRWLARLGPADQCLRQGRITQ